MIEFLRKSFLRIFIFIFWILVITGFLFFPKMSKFFKNDRSITIFSFPLLIDAKFISEFELRTGIKLYIHYYETNDGLLSKLRSSDQHGYDIIFPSDYVVSQLIKEDRLQKLDHSKLKFFKNINPQLCGLYYDPKNEYSIPYLWEVYGLGYNKEFFSNKKPEASWALVFDEKKVPANIGMLNNAREAICVAALYLFGSIENIDDDKLQKIQKLLLDQKKHVSIYSDIRSDYLLLSKTCSVIVCSAGDLWMAKDERIDFILPEEGGFVSVDNICIPKSCDNTELVYQFINYLYEAEVVKHHSDKYFFFPAISFISFSDRGKPVLDYTLKNFDKFNFYKTGMLSERKINNLWISLKSQ